MRLIDSLCSTPVIITTGTGGVGKTTMSCALAVSIAQEKDARVLVITIDPAKRLARVLSQERLGHYPVLIDHSRFVNAPVKGEVYGAMVDTSIGWNEIVTRYAHSDDDAQRIFSNSLYKNLTTRFSHSHDFVAMDQLYGHYRSGNYDFIVLDTPPTSQAFGFFDAPSAMSDFFGGKMVRLVTAPYRMGKGRLSKLFDVASQPFFALADKVLGGQFLNDIGEFFFLFHTMYDDFVKRAQSITDFLSSGSVQACMVVNPTQFISVGYTEMIEGLKQREISINNILINNVAFELDEIKRIKEDDRYKNRSKDIQGFDELIDQEIRLSEKIYQLLKDKTLRQSAQSSGDNYRFYPIIRAYNQDVSKRLSQLIQSVQNSTLLDDTI